MLVNRVSNLACSFDDAFRELDEFGYAVLPNVLTESATLELRNHVEAVFLEEGESAGSEFKQEPGCRRLANLLAKGRIFQRLVYHVAVLPLVTHVLSGQVKLSSLNARSANPKSGRRQPLHCDMGALPDQKGFWVCNVVWMLDDFTVDNGPLRVIPGSHRSGQLPEDALDDPFADVKHQSIVTGRAGTAVVLNAHTWHGGLENTTARSRTAVHAFYCRRDKPQQQYQKQILPQTLQDEVSSELRYLLALDDHVNDELARQDVKRSGFLDRL